MSDTTVKKVNSHFSPQGPGGQKYLVSGVSIAMRMWEEDPGPASPEPTRRDYETVGYLVQGKAELELEGQKLLLEPGDSWLVPKDAVHRYRVIEPLVALEATSPPARVHARDE